MRGMVTVPIEFARVYSYVMDHCGLRLSRKTNPKRKQTSVLIPIMLGFLFVAPIAPAHGQSLVERHRTLRKTLNLGDTDGALLQLRDLMSVAPEVFVDNNYDYLMARLLHGRGDYATSASLYQSVVARDSVLAQYALWHLAQLARSTGNLTLERVQLRQLSVAFPDSLLHEVVKQRIARSLLESRDYSGVIANLRPASNNLLSTLPRDILWMLAEGYIGNTQPAEARNILDILVTQLPAGTPDDFALTAARQLDLLDNVGAASANEPLREADYIRRARIYHFNRDFEPARLHYRALISSYPNSGMLPEAHYQIGRTFYQQGNYNESRGYFEQVISKYHDSPVFRDALGFKASSLARLGRYDEAVVTYKTLIEESEGKEGEERPYLNLIDTLRDAKRDREALDWVEQTRKRFAGKTAAALALFSRARIHLSAGRWDAAIADLEALAKESDTGGIRTPGGTNNSEIAFLRACALEQSGRRTEAVDAYLKIPDGRNEYYGQNATARLQALKADESLRVQLTGRLESLVANSKQALSAGRVEDARTSAQNALRLSPDAITRSQLMETIREAYRLLPRYRGVPKPNLIALERQEPRLRSRSMEAQAPDRSHIADDLLFLGLFDEGAPEYAATRRPSGRPVVVSRTLTNDVPKQPALADAKASLDNSAISKDQALSEDQAFSLAVYFRRGDNADQALRYAEPRWRNVPDDYMLELAPPEMVSLLYPAPYKSSFLKHGRALKVDPRLMLSIARQETRFRPDAKSVAAARGLMQFIPSTADRIAVQLGIDGFDQNWLYEPDIAIRFGTQYVANLFKLFPDLPAAVAASYNGGEDNVERWISRSRSRDPDRFVAEMGFAQTKDYVFKVLANHRVYETLYDEALSEQR
jgi:soluble lytic murein transglycosylase-like protein/predicted negative regulator of RcsB-dependent stress response